jgi:transposase InsO family protein
MFIKASKGTWPVRVMCDVLEVSPSGFYAWLSRDNEPSVAEAELLLKMRTIFARSRGTYGRRRMAYALQQEGLSVGRHRVRRLMREDGMTCKHAKRKRRVTTTDSKHSDSIAPNVLDRKFDPPAPNMAWSCDITYLRTATGFVYLAIVMDLYSRRIIGWSVGDHITQELTLRALWRAWKQRERPRGVVVHSDRGRQYAAADYSTLIVDRMHCTPSMSRKGNCWDNAPVESFFSTLKVEGIDDVVFADLEEAQHSIWRYIEVWYNEQRPHSSNGYLSPVEKERVFFQSKSVA